MGHVVGLDLAAHEIVGPRYPGHSHDAFEQLRAGLEDTIRGFHGLALRYLELSGRGPHRPAFITQGEVVAERGTYDARHEAQLEFVKHLPQSLGLGRFTAPDGGDVEFVQVEVATLSKR